jgi:enediyne polyketide synthase
MGERLGVLDALSERGVTAISAEDGIAMLRRLITDAPAETALVVAGRFGLPPTVRLKDAQLPLLRFLERPLLHYPKVELVADSVLSADADPYLTDHVLSGSFILPGVFGIEAMAQAAAALAPDARTTCITDLVFREAVAAGSGERVTLRVAALRRTLRATELALRCSSTGFQSDHARAVLGFDDSRGDAVPVATTRGIDPEPAADLYDRMLFHGERFRRVAGYQLLTARDCVADIKPGTGQTWFGAFLPATLLLGDPGVRDAALHALQACIPHRRVLPVGAARIDAGWLALDANYIVTAKERTRSADRFTFDFDICAPDGAVVERWVGLELQAIEPLAQPSSWPVLLAGAYLERRLDELLGAPVRIGLAERRAEALALAAIDPGSVHLRPDGKPLVSTGGVVSIAHAPSLTLAGGPRRARSDAIWKACSHVPMTGTICSAASTRRSRGSSGSGPAMISTLPRRASGPRSSVSGRRICVRPCRCCSMRCPKMVGLCCVVAKQA